MKKRLLVFVLTATMVLSFAPQKAGLAFSDSADSKEVQFLEALDIMSRDEVTGFFWDETPVKRSEMAQILCSVLGLTATEDAEQRFFDVQGDARAYVETIVRNGFMSGYSEDSFGPEDYITNKQLVKIIVSLLGAGPVAELRGGYPDGFISVAEELDLIIGTGANLESVSKRIDVAELLYNAMHADIVQILSYSNGFGNYDRVEGETFLTERMGIYRVEGIVSQNDVTSLARSGGLGENQVLIGDEVCLDYAGILEDSLGSSVTVYVKKDEPDDVGVVIYKEDHKKNNTVTVIDEDILPVAGNTFRYYVNSKEKNLSISPVADMIYNGVAIDKDLEKLSVKNGYVKFVDNNGDRVFDVCIVTNFATSVVESVNVENEKIVLQFGSGVLNLKDVEYKIYKDGKFCELKDIVKGDVLSIAKSEDGKVLRIEGSSDSVTGVISEIYNDGMYALVSDKEYKISDYFHKLSDSGVFAELTPGVAGKLSLDVLGRIVCYTPTVSTKNVGYLVDYNYNDEDGDGILIAEIFSQDSKIAKYRFADTVSVDGSGMKLIKLVENDEVMNNLSTPQLVEYEAENGILTKIDFGGQIPNPDNSAFSLDASGSLTTSSSGVFEHKYYLSDKTKVFLVPSNSAYFGNESYYELRKGPYFTVSESRNVWLYDIDEFGNVSYAVTKYDPQWSQIGYGNGLVLVTQKSKAIGADGSVIDVFECVSEAGQPVTIKTDDFSMVVRNKKVRTKGDDGKTTVTISKDAALELEVGDVIQYKTNQSGYLHSIVVQHEVSTEEFYMPESIEPSNTRTGIPHSSYGKVMRNNGNQILLTCDDYADITGTIDVADMLVMNTGKAVYKVFRGNGRATVEKIEFSDILPEDKIFASVNSSNTAKMIVVYE